MSFYYLLALIILSAIFSSSESSLISITKGRANALAKKRWGWIIKKLKDEQDKAVISILLGNNLVNIGATALATEIGLQLFKDFSIALVTGIMTLVILTFGEVIPKIIATAYAEKYLLLVGPFLYIWYLISTPFVVLYHSLTSFIKSFLGKEEPLVTEDELEEMIKIGAKEGEIEKSERDIILSAIELSDTTAEEVMIPKDKVFAVDENTTIEDLLKKMNKGGKYFTRIPIYKESIDKITGILHIKELTKVVGKKGWKKKKVKEIVHKPLFVSEYTPLTSILDKMKKEKLLISVVLDERGLVSGILTLEDILEELVGEIYDEFDRVKRHIWKTKDNAFIVDGSLSIYELCEKTGICINDESVVSIAEYVLKHVKDVPKEGMQFSDGNYFFEVKRVVDNKVERVKIKKI